MLSCGGMLLLSGVAAALEPSAERIKTTLEQVIAKGPYDLDQPDTYFFAMEWLRDLIGAVLKFFGAFAESSSGAVRVITIAVLVIVLLALLGHIFWSFYVAIRVRRESGLGSDGLEALGDPVQLEQTATELAAAGDYVGAVRKLYHAALAMLEKKREGRVMPALTATEYLETFRTPWVVENLRVFADLINWKWYKGQSFDEEDYGRCNTAFTTIKKRLAEHPASSTPSS